MVMVITDEKPNCPTLLELRTAGQDMELQAIAHIMSILEQLSDDGKHRALDYLCDRYPRIEVRTAYPSPSL